MTKPVFLKKLKELFVRFNTSPKLYLKSDFYLLLLLLGGLFENSEGGGSIEVETKGEGNVVTSVTKENDTLVVTKGQARYPRARWARRGFIDLTNCKDIDYIIVPCTSKLQCLYVTNDYLKKLRHIETYESIYGLELELNENGKPIIPEDFFRVVSKYFDNLVSTTPIFYRQPRVLDLQLLNTKSLPCTTDIEQFINVKEFAITKNPSDDLVSLNPLKLLFTRKDTHNGFILFPYFRTKKVGHVEEHKPDPKAGEEQSSYSYLETKFVFTPYMVFANPFNSTLGGVIPVKDGKLLIERATRLKNKTLELVSTGELVRFDEYGILDTLLNPNTFVYTTRKVAKTGKSGKRECERKVIIRNKVPSPRRSSSNVRRNIRMGMGMKRMYKKHTKPFWDWQTIKWYLLKPLIVPKRCYLGRLFLYLICMKEGKPITLEDFDNLKKHEISGHLLKYSRGGYLGIPTHNNTLSLHGPVLKFFKAPYDRMNTYTINKYSPLTKVILTGSVYSSEEFSYDILTEYKHSV